MTDTRIAAAASAAALWPRSSSVWSLLDVSSSQSQTDDSTQKAPYPTAIHPTAGHRRVGRSPNCSGVGNAASWAKNSAEQTKATSPSTVAATLAAGVMCECPVAMTLTAKTGRPRTNAPRKAPSSAAGAVHARQGGRFEAVAGGGPGSTGGG